MVMVPGITTPAAVIAFAAERLAGVGRDVYVLDMRGRGLSERAPYGQHRSGDYAQDVLALVEHAQLEQPILLGHSLGARVVSAARAAVPGSSSAVIAIDPPVSGPGRRPYPMTLAQFVDGLHEAYAGRAEEDTRKHYLNWSEEQIQARGKWLSSCDEVAVVESYAWFHLEAFQPVWARVDAPALLVYGTESPVVTDVDVQELQGVNPRAAVAAVPRSGHMVPWDNLDDLVRQVDEFLAGADLEAGK